jgi:hypothetical protein
MRVVIIKKKEKIDYWFGVGTTSLAGNSCHHLGRAGQTLYNT